MIVLASILSLALAIWAIAVVQHRAAPRWLWAVAAVLVLGTVAAWVIVGAGLAGSVWALASERGASREHDAWAGLAVASSAGLGLLVVCVVSCVFVVRGTLVVKRRLDRDLAERTAAGRAPPGA